MDQSEYAAMMTEAQPGPLLLTIQEDGSAHQRATGKGHAGDPAISLLPNRLLQPFSMPTMHKVFC